MRLTSVLERRPVSGGLTAIALFGVALSLGACGTNRGVSSLNTPVVTTQALSRDIAFTPDHGLTPEDAASLQAFLASMKLGSGDRLALDDPHPDGAAARRAAVAAIVARSGGQLSEAPPPAHTAMPHRTARLWIVRAEAIPPACPNWSSNPSANMTAATHSNYGCAVNSNLAAMVADPNDLVEGQPYAGPNAADIARSHDRWHRRVPTGYTRELTNTSTKSGD